MADLLGEISKILHDQLESLAQNRVKLFSHSELGVGIVDGIVDPDVG